MLKLGNTSFNTDNLEGMTKDLFFKTYKGLINMDIDKAWKEVKKHTRKKKK